MKKTSLFLLLPALSFMACKQSQEASTVQLEEIVLEEEVIASRTVYRAEDTRKHDLLHTKLDVRFDWEKQYLYGKAELTLRPYFYSTDKLELDAKGFDLREISLLVEGTKTPLDYEYDGWHINIDLGKTFNRTEVYKIFIDYTAKPNELNSKGGSAAITGDKGLYFINPTGENPNVKPQLWTQGETEASSCWFPTIDSPNERTTQEIAITVKDEHVSLSNGLLVRSVDNGDGTHTDYWSMDKPHAPYLFMMAVGPFSIIDDKWRDIEVDYYVEEEEAPYAKLIFGKTPEMLEFYSDLLGVDYPWSKYHQVVVREYVSGAMENTTGVIFGDFMYDDERSYLDGNGEDVVAHELFHHWFGDLVTCESWANLPLNESFATYGEYLWREYKYGRESADHHLMNDLNNYLAEAQNGKTVDMIRFDYDDKEDMFDSHSYAKGGRILHMLRKYLGDEAFFEGLKVYLQRNAFQAVEIHELRLAMEDVCGEDLNWFFNQWFLDNGHPVLEIETNFNAESSVVEIEIEQEQDLEEFPLYKLPIEVDVYTASGKERHTIVMDKQKQTFSIPTASKPRWVNVDAEKMLLCEKDEDKPLEEWVAQFEEGPLFIDRLEALEAISKGKDKAVLASALKQAYKDDYYYIRKKAVELSRKLSTEDEQAHRASLENLAKSDEKAAVREAAVKAIAKNYEEQDASFYLACADDLSYATSAAALKGLNKHFPNQAYELAKRREPEAKKDQKYAVAEVYAENGSVEHMSFFNNIMDKLSGFEIFSFSSTYVDYLSKQDISVIKENLNRVTEVAENGDPWYIRYAGMQMMIKLKEEMEDKETEAASAFAEELEAKMKSLKEKETHPQLKRIYGVSAE